MGLFEACGEATVHRLVFQALTSHAHSYCPRVIGHQAAITANESVFEMICKHENL